MPQVQLQLQTLHHPCGSLLSHLQPSQVLGAEDYLPSARDQQPDLLLPQPVHHHHGAHGVRVTRVFRPVSAWRVRVGGQGHQSQLLVPHHLYFVDEHHPQYFVPHHRLDRVEYPDLQVLMMTPMMMMMMIIILVEKLRSISKILTKTQW